MKKSTWLHITAVLFITTVNGYAEDAFIKLESTYIVSMRELTGNSTVAVAEVETYIENVADREIRVLSLSREFEIKSSNRYFVYSAGIGKRSDGKIIKPSESAFNPVRLLPGEVARLPALRVILAKNERTLTDFKIYYSVTPETGAALGVWHGQLECTVSRRAELTQ